MASGSGVGLDTSAEGLGVGSSEYNA